MISRFELSPEQIKIKEILRDRRFIEIELYVVSDAEPNRNGSCFTLESMNRCLDSFTNMPILGYFNEYGDFEGHNAKPGYDAELQNEFWDNENGEQILGFMRESDERRIVTKDNLHWIYCTAMIYTQYNYRQVKRLLKDKRKKISIEVNFKDTEVRNDIVYVKDFEVLGITILGSRKGAPVIEGIPGAHLSVLDKVGRLDEQRTAICFAYHELEGKDKKEDGDLAKNDVGAKHALKIDRSKRAMSDSDWGAVDKAALRKEVVEAKNFKEIAPYVFLDLREGWEDGEVSKLKYPVMQLKGQTLVYNREALGVAKGYAEKNHEEEVLKKLKEIYEHLDLRFEADENFDCGDFCDLYENAEQPCEQCGQTPCVCENKFEEGLMSVVAEENDDHDDDDDHDDHDDDNHDDDDDHDNDGHDDDDHDDDIDDENDDHDDDCDDDDPDEDNRDDRDDDKEQYKKLQEECDTLRMQCKNYEDMCKQYTLDCEAYEKRCAEYESEIEKLKEELSKCADYDQNKQELEALRNRLAEIERAEQLQFIADVQCKMNLSEGDIAAVCEKCNKGEYNSKEEIERDIAVIVYQRECKKAEAATTKRFETPLSASVPQSQTKVDRKNLPITERLKQNISKNK